MINLFMLCCACGFSACAGLSALQEDHHQEFKLEEKVEFKQDNKKFVSYNDESYRITFSAYELNNYSFDNLANTLDDEELDLSGTYFYDNSAETTYALDEFLPTDNLTYDSGVYTIFFDLSTSDNHFHLNENDGESNLSFLNDYSWDFMNNHEDTYNNIKTAIQLDIQANTTGQEDYQNAFGQFVQILVSGIQSLATGVASGIVGMASALFLETDNGSVTGLSVFGGIVAIFAGLALAIGITTKVYTWVTSLGN